MSNTNTKNPTDKNKLYIGIFTIIIIIAIIIVAATKGCSSSGTNTNTGSSATNAAAKSISVASEQGDQNATLDANIKIRNVKFSKKMKAIKKYESKQKDTDGEPSVAESNDGYTYLTYKYSADNAPTFFGTQVLPTDINSMLVYVFHNKQLIEVRIQYGNIGKDAYNNIVANINSTYGNATYSRSYSNGTEESWWKTDKTTLDVICQDTGVIAYYRTN